MHHSDLTFGLSSFETIQDEIQGNYRLSRLAFTKGARSRNVHRQKKSPAQDATMHHINVWTREMLQIQEIEWIMAKNSIEGYRKEGSLP